MFEKTNVRLAVQYHPTLNGKSNDPCNTHRQQSSTTTFTTVTNMSPRYDSMATDGFRNIHKDSNHKGKQVNKSHGVDESKNKSTNTR